MREIKFRAKNTENGEWIYGHYSTTIIHRVTYGSIRTNDFKNFIYNVDPETLGQYTGLKDKNGKEIYEGDIVYDPWGDKHIVIWDEESMMFTYDVNEWWMPYLWCRSFEADELDRPEVIGNVYDNPELLGD